MPPSKREFLVNAEIWRFVILRPEDLGSEVVVSSYQITGRVPLLLNPHRLVTPVKLGGDKSPIFYFITNTPQIFLIAQNIFITLLFYFFIYWLKIMIA